MSIKVNNKAPIYMYVYTYAHKLVLSLSGKNVTQVKFIFFTHVVDVTILNSPEQFLDQTVVLAVDLPRQPLASLHLPESGRALIVVVVHQFDSRSIDHTPFLLLLLSSGS